VVDRSDQPASIEDLIVEALEAENGALRSLEVAVTLAADREEEQRLQAAVLPALDHLRAALAELRAFTAAGPVSAGFVLPGPAGVNPRAGGLDPENPLRAAMARIARR
jgi:hypothetical protein